MPLLAPITSMFFMNAILILLKVSFRRLRQKNQLEEQEKPSNVYTMDLQFTTMRNFPLIQYR